MTRGTGDGEANKETHRRPSGKLLQSTGWRASQTQAQWRAVSRIPCQCLLLKSKAQAHAHRARTLGGVRGSRVSTRRCQSARRRRSSRDELTRRMEVDLKEQNARVSSVASCGLGVGLAVSGLEEEEAGGSVRRRGGPCWPRGPCSAAASSLYARSQALAGYT
jgi:hypothetical protein